MKKNQQGVSLFEVILVIGIVGLITSLVINQVNDYFKKTKSQQYGYQSIIFAKAFSRYIINNYKQYYDSSKTGIQHIKYQDLGNANHLPPGMKNQQNVYGYTPCVSLVYNKSLDSIQAVMFFTTKNIESDVKISLKEGADAMMTAGASAGVINTDKSQVNGAGRAWKIDNNNGNEYDLYFKSNGCDYSEIPQNSLVVNLSMLSDFVLQQSNESQANSNKYLYRLLDDNKDCPPGNPCNRNTLNTDIIMNSAESGITKYHSINFGVKDLIDEGPILTSGSNPELERRGIKSFNNEVVLAGGGFAANNLRPMLLKENRDSCSENELGTMVLKKLKLAESAVIPEALIQNQLVCSRSIVCRSDKSTNDYCYLPISDFTITYNQVNKFDFKCPDGTYIDISTPFVVTTRHDSDEIVDSTSWRVKPNYSQGITVGGVAIFRAIIPQIRDRYGEWDLAPIKSVTCSSNPVAIRIK